MVENDNHSEAHRSMRRRRYLGIQAVVAAGLAAGGGLVTGSDTANADRKAVNEDQVDNGVPTDSFTTTVTMDADERGERAVPETLFGRFAEHYGAHESYPGIYAEHVTNTSFVAWGQVQPDHVSHVYGFDEVGRYDGLPFPWEPVGNAAFERPAEGGVRGLGTWESDGGWPIVDQEPRNKHQRVVLDDATGGVKQRLVLPDWRTLTYEFALSTRTEGIDALTVRLTAPDGDVLASTTVETLTSEWTRYDELELALTDRSGSQLAGGALDDIASPYGEYVLEIDAEETGHVDLDWISLLPADAVNRKFNPTTIDLMDDRNVSLLKWPAGTSPVPTSGKTGSARRGAADQAERCVERSRSEPHGNRGVRRVLRAHRRRTDDHGRRDCRGYRPRVPAAGSDHAHGRRELGRVLQRVDGHRVRHASSRARLQGAVRREGVGDRQRGLGRLAGRRHPRPGAVRRACDRIRTSASRSVAVRGRVGSR
ncbi:hypothetical protein [Natrialba taiwanensis]|uniref:hypothetical protein n=1 Tax=Natrialba taiwanensis TaxID=160846 RepID=UPI001267EE93|nr:hypothetical protein [Natrialba taiwanensis]